MSAKKDDKPQAAPAGDAAPAKKGLPIKTIAIVAVVMVVEAIAVFMILSMMGPKKVEAHVDEHAIVADHSDSTVEIQIADEKFQNLQTGRVWLWDIAVFVQVKQKNQEKVEATLKQRNAEVKEEISRIISRAQHVQLKEPDRQTLLRQFTAALNKVFENDEHGAPVVERVLIPKCRGFPADF